MMVPPEFFRPFRLPLGVAIYSRLLFLKMLLRCGHQASSIRWWFSGVENSASVSIHLSNWPDTPSYFWDIPTYGMKYGLYNVSHIWAIDNSLCGMHIQAHQAAIFHEENDDEWWDSGVPYSQTQWESRFFGTNIPRFDPQPLLIGQKRMSEIPVLTESNRIPRFGWFQEMGPLFGIWRW
jgi:hypothetical protein